MKYRSRSEIVSSILLAAREVEGITKTKIMYNSYLSFAQLKEYMALLLENGLLEYMPENNRYRTTEKGVKMVAAWERVNEMISEPRA
jgi:predicted transcriptional regulator